MGTITSSRLSRQVRILVCAVTLCLIISGPLSPAYAQGFVNFSKSDGHKVLKVIKKDIEKNYYDPNFRGIDLEVHFRRVEEKINVATSTSQVFGIIAQALVDFDDSHIRFLPPSRTTRIEYGWQMRMIGDKCYVVAVKPGSDAEAKGLTVGNLILSIDGYEPYPRKPLENTICILHGETSTRHATCHTEY